MCPNKRNCSDTLRVAACAAHCGRSKGSDPIEAITVLPRAFPMLSNRICPFLFLKHRYRQLMIDLVVLNEVR